MNAPHQHSHINSAKKKKEKVSTTATINLYKHDNDGTHDLLFLCCDVACHVMLCSNFRRASHHTPRTGLQHAQTALSSSFCIADGCAGICVLCWQKITAANYINICEGGQVGLLSLPALIIEADINGTTGEIP